MFTVLAIIANIFAFNYRKGETFSYHFHNSVETKTGVDDNVPYATTVTVDLNATFTVQNAVSDGVYVRMTLSNYMVTITDENGTETIGPDASIDEYLGKPLYFKLRKSGAITDVISSKEDTQEIVNMKLAVAFALRTNLEADLDADYQEATVIDPMGKHTEYTTVGRRGNSITVETYFSDSDFIGFSDKEVQKGELSIDSQSTHVIDNDKVTTASATTTVVLCKSTTGDRDNEDDEESVKDIPITITGTYLLSEYTEMEDSVENDEITSIAKFLSQNRGYGTVASLRDSFYTTSFSSLEKTVAGASTSHCPSACNLCKSYSNGYTGGNKNLGFRASASAVVGVQSGCKAAKRSYIIGAYANVDIYIHGHTISALSAYAEYGQLNGSAQRNGLNAKLFGISVYDKKFDQLNCKSGSKSLYSNTKSHSFTYNIPVFCVTVQLTASVKFTLNASVSYKICPNQFNASATFKPSASVTLSGKASANAGIAKASLELSGTISDHLDPTAYVDGNKCRIGFKASNYLSSINIKLQAYFEILDWKRIWSKNEKYKSSKKWNLYSTSIGGKTTKLADVHWP